MLYRELLIISFFTVLLTGCFTPDPLGDAKEALLKRDVTALHEAFDTYNKNKKDLPEHYWGYIMGTALTVSGSKGNKELLKIVIAKFEAEVKEINTLGNGDLHTSFKSLDKEIKFGSNIFSSIIWNYPFESFNYYYKKIYTKKLNIKIRSSIILEVLKKGNRYPEYSDLVFSVDDFEGISEQILNEAFYYALDEGMFSKANKLLSLGASVNQVRAYTLWELHQQNSCDAPLIMTFSKKKKLKVVQYLHNAGATLNVSDCNGHSLLDIARINKGSEELESWIKTQGIKSKKSSTLKIASSLNQFKLESAASAINNRRFGDFIEYNHKEYKTSVKLGDNAFGNNQSTVFFKLKLSQEEVNIDDISDFVKRCLYTNNLKSSHLLSNWLDENLTTEYLSQFKMKVFKHGKARLEMHATPHDTAVSVEFRLFIL